MLNTLKRRIKPNLYK